MFVRMVTDISNQERGFEIKFRSSNLSYFCAFNQIFWYRFLFLDRLVCNNIFAMFRPFNSLNKIILKWYFFFSDCKREIHDLRGAIESPNFPANYPHYSSCEWKLVPPMGNRIYIEFSHFDLEHTWSIDDNSNQRSASCMFDHLTIEERDSSDQILRSDKHCAEMPKPMNTTRTVVLKCVSAN